MRCLVSLRLSLLPPASYPHIPCPKTGERRVLLPNVNRLRSPHHMFRVPLSTKHHAISCNSCTHHRIFPGLPLFPVLFHQGFLGRTSTRCGSREGEVPQPRIGFLRCCNMDIHRCLHLVGIDEESLHSEILSLWYGARSLRLGCVKPRRDGLATALLESGVQSLYYHSIFVVHRDRAGKEGNLATRRAIPAKVCHSMVSSTLNINAILPNPDAFTTNRKTIGRRYPFVFFMSIGVYPLTSWIWTTELTVWFWTYYLWTKAKNVGFVSIVFINETQISFSFGQVCL